MERQLAVHARAHRQALSAVLAALVLASPTTSALAAPKSADAKAAFERGVKAYTGADYAAAREALSASFALEADAETLFAWAQTERQLGRCDKAIELYEKLLAFELPAENEAATQAKLDECKQILAAQQPAPEPAPATLSPDPAPVAPSPAHAEPSGRAWWKDPVGVALVGVGVGGLAVGGVYLVLARSADQDKASAPTYGDYQRLEDRAEARGTLGVIAAASGAVLLGAGIVWYATRGGDERGTQVTGWVTPDGGGLVAAGRF